LGSIAGRNSRYVVRRVEFEVALSYASEDRSLVEKLPKYCTTEAFDYSVTSISRPKCGGEDLYVYLVLSTRLPSSLPFWFSHADAAKPWTNQQRQSAQARALRGLYLLEGLSVTVCVVASVAWEGSPVVAVSG
jgi:hypothetical protein